MIYMFMINSESKQFEGVFRIVSKKSRRVVSFSCDNETSGVVVLQEEAQEGRERWRFISKGKHFLIQSAFSNHYLSVYNSSLKAGAGLVTMELFNVDSEKFSLLPTGISNEFCIETFCNLVLDCCGEDETPGTRVIQWWQSKKDHQRWLIEPV